MKVQYLKDNGIEYNEDENEEDKIKFANEIESIVY
jgi:hypothetical protein